MASSGGAGVGPARGPGYYWGQKPGGFGSGRPGQAKTPKTPALTGFGGAKPGTGPGGFQGGTFPPGAVKQGPTQTQGGNPAQGFPQGPGTVSGGPVRQTGTFGPAGGTGAGGPGTTPGAPPGTQLPPLDATYYANVGAHDFQVGNQINALNQANAYGSVDLQNALGKLGQQQPLDQLKLLQAANNHGALYSSVANQQQAQLVGRYLDQQQSDQRSYDRASAGRTSQINALLGGEPLYDAQQAVASVGRATTTAANDPSLGQGTGNSSTASGGKPASTGSSKLAARLANTTITPGYGFARDGRPGWGGGGKAKGTGGAGIGGKGKQKMGH